MTQSGDYNAPPLGRGLVPVNIIVVGFEDCANTIPIPTRYSSETQDVDASKLHSL